MENRKFKRGMLSVAITSGVLVAVILFNLLFTFLANRFLWVIDTMPNDLVKISDYSKELLDQVDPETNDIKLYFLAAPDELNNYELTGHKKGESGSSWGMSYIYNLAKLYEKEFGYFSVALLDTSEDADYIRQNFALTIGTNLTPLTMVMTNTVEGRTSYRTVSRDEFFLWSNDAMYFRGEDKLTSTILSLSGESPVAYFLEGHGENVGPAGDESDFGSASSLAGLFEEAGYIVKKIDLSKTDFPAENDDAVHGAAATVVIYGPTEDFDVSANANEITRLRKFLHRKHHNLMVFKDPGTGAMPHLDEYLADYWGVEFEDNIVQADTSDLSNTAAISKDGLSYYADYQLDKSSPGSTLTSALTTLDSLPGAYFGKSCTIAMKKNWSSNQSTASAVEGWTSYKLGAAFLTPALSTAVYANGGGYACFDSDIYEKFVAEHYDEKYASILAEYTDKRYQKYYDTHYEKNREDYEKEGLSAAEIDAKCKTFAENTVKEDAERFMSSWLALREGDPYAVMTLTHGQWMYKTNETVPMYLLACGSTAYASNDAIENAAYSNRDVLYSAVYLFSKNVLPYDIDVIKLVDTSALSISDAMTVTWTVILCAVMPLSVIGAGIFVLIRRRKHN